VYRNNLPYSALYRNNFPYSAQCTGTTLHILHSVQEQLSVFCTVYRNNLPYSAVYRNKFPYFAQCTGTTTGMSRVRGKLILKKY
jgi:hypothetical protein